MDIRRYDGSKLNEGIDLALKHRLYVSGWALSGSLIAARQRPNRRERLALAFKDGVAVAIGWYDGNMAMAFCKKSERRQGLASACISALELESAVAGEGLIGTGKFWKRCGVRDHFGYRW